MWSIVGMGEEIKRYHFFTPSHVFIHLTAEQPIKDRWLQLTGYIHLLIPLIESNFKAT